MRQHFLCVCAALFALMILCPAMARADDNVYAILYDDGTLVFQHGNTPESGKTVTNTYEVDLNAIYSLYYDVPWYDEWESIRVVNFADKISPSATAFWFDDCANLERVDNIQNLDTTNVTSMVSMFCGCRGLKALDVSKFDTANVTDMSSMFYDCRVLTALDVSKFNTANVTDMSGMFDNCSGLTALDVSKFDTANVTSMYGMFCGCSGLTALDVSHFDTANVTSMVYMFFGCSRLTALDISNFDTAKVYDMRSMFYGCSKLKIICASDKFTTASVTYSSGMFSGCTSLVGGNGTKYDIAYDGGSYARIDTPSAPGYFTAPGGGNNKDEEMYVITAYVGEGGTVTPEGDCRVRAGENQTYVITPNPGYGVQSVRIDGVDMGALSEYVFKNVVRDHSIFVSFARLPHYAITAAVKSNGQLSVTLENTSAVTVAVSYFDGNGQFVSADMKNVSADAGNVTFTLSGAYRARVSLFDSGCRPLCDPVSVS